MRLVVALCTRDRSILLKRCLRSLSSASVPDELTPAIVVVENNLHRECEQVVMECARRSTIPVHYHLEPNLGIPQARNRSVAEAMALDADWIGFVDDDEAVSTSWWIAASNAIKTLDAEVIYGQVKFVAETPMPSWLPSELRRRKSTGTIITTAPTNNTLVKRSVFAMDGLALRFNPDLRFLGGSDSQLFERAHAAGANLMLCNELEVTEYWPPQRLTRRWHLKRKYWRTINRELRGRTPIGVAILKALLFTFRAASYLILSAILFMFRNEKSARMYFKALIYFTRAAAYATSRFYRKGFEIYRSID